MFKNFSFKWPIANPCLPLLVIALLTAAPLLVAYAFNISVFLTSLIVIPVLALVLKSTKSLRRDAGIILITLFSTLIAISTSHTHLSIHTNKSKSYILFRGTVENVHYHDESLNWEAAGNSKAVVVLREIYKNGVWEKCSGKIHVEDKDNQFKYGQDIEAEGALFKYNFDESDKLFSYGLYLKYMKISHLLRLNKLHKTEPPSGYRAILKKCFSLRDSIIGRAGKGLQEEKDRKLLASMFFGYKGLLSVEEKETFKRSGTVHLFAVSGLHIGIAAVFILSILKLLQLNLKLQTIILISCLGLYVIMTGSPASAVRAFVMISVWSTARGFMLPSNGMNNVCFSAFILILANPLNLLSAGFYYTFIITAFLVITYIKSLEIFQNLMEKKLWVGRSGFSQTWKLNIFLLISCSFIASLATFGLNLLVNEKVIPFAVITNIAASSLAWLSFMLAVLSLTGIPFFYRLQELTLDAIRFTAERGEYSWDSSASLWAVLLFYIILFSLPYVQKAKSLKICLSSLTALLLILGWPTNQNNIQVSVPSSSNIATILIQNQGRNYLINCSSRKVIYEMFHRKVHALILPDVRADHIRYLEDLLNNSSVGEIVIFRKPTAYLKRILKETGQSHLLKVDLEHRLVQKFSSEKGKYSLVFHDRAIDHSDLKLTLSRKELSTTNLTADLLVNGEEHKNNFTFSYSNKGYNEKISF